MQEIVEQMDEVLFAARDSRRYVPKDIRSRMIETLLGQVEIKRRYYLDLETGKYVALLDEYLGISKRDRVSQGLATAASFLAVQGPSYRGASSALGEMLGYKALSHESIRRLILNVGETAKRWQQHRLKESEGRRKVRLLFVEADGYWVAMQKHKGRKGRKRRKRETRLMVAHEGWKPRSTGSKEYELLERTHHFELKAGDFWYDASLALYNKYDIDDKTMIVINGDRAPWIRKGVNYFPNAIYQVDRFHVKRDLKRYLECEHDLHNAMAAFDNGKPEELRRVLLQAAAKETDSKVKKGLTDLCKEIARIPDSFIDYRLRLEEMGYDVQGLRGMGSMESNVNRFSNRTKKRGRSWGMAGLEAITHSLVSQFEGRLASLTRHVSQLAGILDEQALKSRLGKIPGHVYADMEGAGWSAVPIMKVGTTRSGGMSKMFRGLLNTTPAMT